jgi:FAD/FMN-containing dehydrogenase
MSSSERARGEESWNDSVVVWNGLVATVPALVVRPASPRELAAAAAFARDHGLHLTVKADGAAFPAERCLTLDLSDSAPRLAPL